MSKEDDFMTPVDEALLRGDDVPDEAAQDKPAEESATETKVDDKEQPVPEEKDEGTAPAAEGEPKEKAAREREGYVPLDRFSQVYASEKAKTERIAELERQLVAATQKTEEPAKEVDVKALRKQAQEAFVDGEMDKYNELQEQIDSEIERRAENKALERVRQDMQAERQSQEQVLFNQKVVELTQKYPVLDQATGNQEAIAMVIDLRDSYIAKGMAMSQALEQAANKVAPLFERPAQSQKTPAQDARTLKAVEIGVKTNEKIPQTGGGVGARAQEPQEKNDFTQDEWAALPIKERKARLEAA